MTRLLETVPDSVVAADRVLGDVDAALMRGFGGGQGFSIAAIAALFDGLALAEPLQHSLNALANGDLNERHFACMAAAHCALRGAQYDALQSQACAALGRTYEPSDTHPAFAPRRTALHDTTRHWLAELAITGLGRLTPGAIMPFLASLEMLRKQPGTAALGLTLAGFVDEILAALPLSSLDAALAARWGDLWSSAMIQAIGEPQQPAQSHISGRLTPLGIETRFQATFAALVVHGLLSREDAVSAVRIPLARFKVAAISGPETWLLFPECAPILQAMAQGRALELHDMPHSGAILHWQADRATEGPKQRLLDTGLDVLTPGSTNAAASVPKAAHERHPIQVAEPIVLQNARLDGGALAVSHELGFPLCNGWNASSDLTEETLPPGATVFGLLHVEQNRWVIRPLSVAGKNGKLAFIGQSGAKLFAKPPKASAVAILEERASRLLRG